MQLAKHCLGLRAKSYLTFDSEFYVAFSKYIEPEKIDRQFIALYIPVIQNTIHTSLSVPEFTVSIVGTAEELCAIIIEADVSDSLLVT